MYSACIATNCAPGKVQSLRLTIRALKAQSRPPSQIVVSINAADNARFVDQILSAHPDIRIVEATRKLNNVSYARNSAVNACINDYLVFLDDDTVLASMQSMKDIMENSVAFDFACGAQRLWTPPNWQQTISELFPISYIQTILQEICMEPVNINRADGQQRLSNFSFFGNFGIASRSAFEKTGGFDEEFFGWGYEDADIMQEFLHQESRFCLLKSLGIRCFHLSHHADKTKVKDNIGRYEAKIKKRGRSFKLNHIFGTFENDGFRYSDEF